MGGFSMSTMLVHRVALMAYGHNLHPMIEAACHDRGTMMHLMAWRGSYMYALQLSEF